MNYKWKKLKLVKKLIDSIDDRNTVVIHYSCESFYDRPNGASPRITSLAIRNLHDAQTVSFSIHQIAEEEGVLFEEIEQNYDKLEKKMLERFYDYIKTKKDKVWIHWNMRDINYGFQAIGHRFKVLGGNPVELHESQLLDLAAVLINRFGVGYIGHPRLINLIKKNKITDKSLLSGKDEAVAFEQQEYVKRHQSTLRKVDVIANIWNRLREGSLKLMLR